MKKGSISKFFFLFLISFFYYALNVYANSKYVVFQTGTNIRKGPSTSYDVYKTGTLGSKFYLNSDTLIQDTSGNCDGGWYEINYNGSKAYVCSEYVKVYDENNNVSDNIAPTNACQIELKNKGFTSTYFIPLCEIKSKHPNWNFEPIKTGLDFNVVVTQESKCGKSYIETYDTNYYDASCKSAYSPTSIWKPASLGAVRYYIDPRNFLNERYIFMFESLSYMNNIAGVYQEAITSVIKNADFYQYHLSINNNLSSIIDNVGKELNVSPTFISSRIYQEIGASSSLRNLYSGTYPNYTNYYNFYNYGVSDSCSNNTTICGLEYAKKAGWYGLDAAIKGGVSSISKNYIQVGQNTRYLQKFNVAPKDPNSVYTHQYMTNIRAPYGEASTAYNSYKNAGALDSSFSFSIPVYENMPAVTNLPTSPDDNKNNGADNSGSSSTTTPPASTMSPTAIIAASGYRYTDNYITGINPETDVNTFKSALESISGSETITITNSNGNPLSSGPIGTGAKVTIKGSTTKTFEIMINGDISGDGTINALDLLLVQRHLLKTSSLSGVYNKAADINKDGTINSLDLLLVQRHILKTESIKQ